MPANATAGAERVKHPIDTRTTLEQLVDTVDELYMAAWRDELDRQELREGLSEAMGLATKLLDADE